MRNGWFPKRTYRDNYMINFPTLVRTRTKRIGITSRTCDFCQVDFRNKEKRICYRPPWKSRMRNNYNFHQTCYKAYLYQTLLDIQKEIDSYGRNYNSKRRNSTE